MIFGQRVNPTWVKSGCFKSGDGAALGYQRMNVSGSYTKLKEHEKKDKKTE